MTLSARLVVTAAVLLAATRAEAQRGSAYSPPPRFEVAGVAGYHVSSDFDFQSGSATLDDGVSYGATLRAHVRPGQSVELLWIHVPTTAHFRSVYGAGDASLAIDYFQIGGSTSIRRDRLEPYFSGTLGAALYSAGTLDVGSRRFSGSDLWRFAFTLGGGLKVWLSERFALQGEARMMAPVWFSSASFYAGSGGAAIGASGGIPIVEGNFTGGLVLAL